MKTIVISLALALSLSPLIAFGMEERSIPISKSISMSVARSVPLRRHANEQPVLGVTFTNQTEKKVALENPWPMVNFKVTATRDGALLPCLLKAPDVVAGAVGDFELGPRKSRIITFEVHEWFDVSVPGNYAVVVEFNLTYRGLPPNSNRVTPDERIVARESFRFGKL